MALVFIANLPIVIPTPLGFVGGLCPSVAASVASPSVQLSASLTGSLALNASFSATPPTLGIYLTGLETIAASISEAIILGEPACSFGVNVSAGLSVVADLEASLNLALTVGLPNLSALLSASIGAYAFTYTGPASGLGAALTTELASSWPDGAPSSGPCNAVILVAPSSVASVLLGFLNGLPASPPPGLSFIAKLSALSQLSISTADSISEATAALNAQLTACATISASLTPQVNVELPTLAVMASATANAIVNLKAAIAAGFKAPSVSVVLDATAKLSASISANFGAMASLGLVLGRFDALFGVYTYAGTGTALGAAVTAGITDPSDVTAVVLATTDFFSWTILTGFFGGAL